MVNAIQESQGQARAPAPRPRPPRPRGFAARLACSKAGRGKPFFEERRLKTNEQPRPFFPKQPLTDLRACIHGCIHTPACLLACCTPCTANSLFTRAERGGVVQADAQGGDGRWRLETF